jgi:hypothetical protein
VKEKFLTRDAGVTKDINPDAHSLLPSSVARFARAGERPWSRIPIPIPIPIQKRKPQGGLFTKAIGGTRFNTQTHNPCRRKAMVA